jgi:hypothetical protein
MTISNVSEKNPKTTAGHPGMAVIGALEDRLSFCSNAACQNGPHNLKLIFNFGFFVRGFSNSSRRAPAATRRRSVALAAGAAA